MCICNKRKGFSGENKGRLGSDMNPQQQNDVYGLLAPTPVSPSTSDRRACPVHGPNKDFSDMPPQSGQSYTHATSSTL